MMRVLPAICFLLFTGCLNSTPPSLAPDAVDANLRWFWVNGDSADDATLIDAASKLSVGGKADTRTSPLKGQMRERLASEDLKNVGLEANDPSTARGLIVVNLFDCTLDKLTNILIAQDQITQYPDVYKSYVRSYTNDDANFRSRGSDLITWQVDLSAALPVDDVYTSLIKGGVRRVRSTAESATKGDFLITRTWLTAPATFPSTSTSYFKQDYQIEVFWEQSPGKIFHAYGMWRDIKVGGFNLTIEDNGFMNIVLDNLVKWDTRTAELCAMP
ncbi:MAG: hypothetical protein QM817_27485 [Archangium sp.]